MENFVLLLVPALLAAFLIRILMLPMKLIFRLLLHSGCGFLCLWILNTTSGLTRMYLPINAVTVAIAGVLGLPGIGIIALLEIVV